MASGSLRKRGKNGVFHAIYTDPATGREVSRSLRTSKRREAERALDNLRHRLGIEGESHVPAREIGLATFCREKWLTERCAVLRDSTRHQYACMVEAMVRFFGEATPVRKALTVARLQAYVGTMVARGRSATTINSHLAVLSSIAGYAVAGGYLDGNPVPGVARPRPPKPEPFAFSADEVRRIIKAAPCESRDLLVVLFGVGLRRSELAGLTVADWVPADSLAGRGTATLHIGRRIWRGRPGEPKTGNRTVAVSASVSQAVTRAAEGKTGDEPLFSAPQGGYVNWDRLARDVWGPTLRRAGVPIASIHVARRTAITMTLGAGVAPQVAARRFGVSVTTMMRHYAAVLDDAAIAAADAVEPALGVFRETPRGSRVA